MWNCCWLLDLAVAHTSSIDNSNKFSDTLDGSALLLPLQISLIFQNKSLYNTENYNIEFELFSAIFSIIAQVYWVYTITVLWQEEGYTIKYVLRAQAISHCITWLESQYSHSQLPLLANLVRNFARNCNLSVCLEGTSWQSTGPRGYK